MYSSPGTPNGTNSPCLSSRYAVVFAFGTPIGDTCESSLVTWYRCEQTVISVGPYTFHNARQRWRSWFARSALNASPPQNKSRSGKPSQPASSNMRHVAGVALMAVVFEVANSGINSVGSEACSRDASTTFAPTNSGRNSSSTEKSNDKVVTASHTASGDRPGLRRML